MTQPFIGPKELHVILAELAIKDIQEAFDKYYSEYARICNEAFDEWLKNKKEEEK